MEKRRRVAVYGDSLNLAGIVASLQSDATLDVFCVSPESRLAGQNLEDRELAAVVFDMSDSPLPLDVAWLRGQPGLLMIGVDPSSEELLILSSQPARVLSMAELVNIIHQKE